MKKLISILFTLFFLIHIPVQSQIFDKVIRKAKSEKDKKENKAIDDIFRGAEESVKTKKDTKEKDDSDDKKTVEESAEVSKESGSKSKATSEKDEIKLWSTKYDFVPGQKVLFYDDYENEEIGEIPSKWKFIGGGIETVRTDNGNKVMQWWDVETRPSFKDGEVLPDAFTVEFDFYLQGPPKSGYGYFVRFYDKEKGAWVAAIDIGYGSMQVHSVTRYEYVPDKKKEEFYNTWHHFALSYNKGSLKGYFDQYRMFNVRLDKGRANYIAFYNCCTTRDNGHVFLIDNVRISEGAHGRYKEEVIENGKIVTNNIHFEYNSADILPYSFAEINRIAEIMKNNSELKFSVQGHTDSDGETDYNLDLSKQRADAVLDALVDMDIKRSRLDAKGMGESVAVASNDTPEGKAMNRRVEFVVKK